MDFVETMSIILPATVILGVIFLVFINLYKKIRRKFPIKVNCWFCNEWSKVDYDLKNCFYCPKCDQYNGFTADGDYNRVIPEQNDEFLNKNLSTKSAVTKNSSGSQNGLCNTCNNNQRLKIHQLAVFSPIDETNFDDEIEKYQLQLERAYPLCSQCQLVVKRTLRQQKSILLSQNLLSSKNLNFLNISYGLRNARKMVVTDLVSLLLASVALLEIFGALKSFFEGYPTTNIPIFEKFRSLGKIFIEPISEVFCYLLSFTKNNFLFYSIENSFPNFFSTFYESFVKFLTLPLIGLFFESFLLVLSKRLPKVLIFRFSLWILNIYLNRTQNKALKYLEVFSGLALFIFRSPKLSKNENFDSKNENLDFSEDSLLSSTPEKTQKNSIVGQNGARNNSGFNGSFNTTLVFNGSLTLGEVPLVKEGVKSPIFGQKATFENPFGSKMGFRGPESNLRHLEPNLRDLEPNFKHLESNSRHLEPDSRPLETFSKPSEPNFRGSDSLFRPLEPNLRSLEPNFRHSEGSLFRPTEAIFRGTNSILNASNLSFNGSIFNASLNGSLLNEPLGSNDGLNLDLSLNEKLNGLHLSSYEVSNPKAKIYSAKTKTYSKPILSPPKLGNCNLTQSSWLAGGYFSNSNSDFSNLSRSSSQSSGFGSQTSTQNLEVFNSLPPSRNTSICGEDRFSVLSEPIFRRNFTQESSGNFHRQRHQNGTFGTFGGLENSSISSQSTLMGHQPQKSAAFGVENCQIGALSLMGHNSHKSSGGVPKSSRGAPENSWGVLNGSRGIPESSRGVPESSRGVPESSWGVPESSMLYGTIPGSSMPARSVLMGSENDHSFMGLGNVSISSMGLESVPKSSPGFGTVPKSSLALESVPISNLTTTKPILSPNSEIYWGSGTPSVYSRNFSTAGSVKSFGTSNGIVRGSLLQKWREQNGFD